MKNIKIKNVTAIEILDSRGNPTLQVEVILENDISGTFSVPSGASTGIYEAHELRDNDKARFNGLGVLKAIKNVNTEIKNALIGQNVFNQEEIDNKLIKLDGTPNKSRLGANAILGVSIACAKAAASTLKIKLYEYLNITNKLTLPRPMMNVINGGVHAVNSLDIQEFMIVPISYKSFSSGISMCVEVFKALKTLLTEKYSYVGYGDEGGFAPNLKNDEEALKLLIKAIEKANYKPNIDFMIALDAASSSWYNNESDSYYLPKAKKYMSKKDLIDMWIRLVETYPIISIEDALSEDDIEGWKLLSNKLNDKVHLVGDDLFVTNEKRLSNGIDNLIANSILIKPNQIGTLTETLKTIELAKKANYTVIISHRSGETNDSFISDLAVATNAQYIKAGAPNRGERVEKYNRLLIIDNELFK